MRQLLVESNPPLGDIREMVLGEPSAADRFVVEMLPALYAAAERYQLDAPGVIAQAGLETGWGHYAGRVPWWFHNTAGLKVPNPTAVLHLLGSADQDHPLVHAQFKDWMVGAAAHAQHLRCYAGFSFPDTIIDPRWDVVWGRYEIRHWSELNGNRWAGPDYGDRVESLAERIDPRHH